MISQNPRIIFRISREKATAMRLALAAMDLGQQHVCEAFVDMMIDHQAIVSLDGPDGPCITVGDVLERARILRQETSDLAHA